MLRSREMAIAELKILKFSQGRIPSDPPINHAYVLA